MFNYDSYYGSNLKTSYMVSSWWAGCSIRQSGIFASQGSAKGSYGKYQANAQHFDSIFDFAQGKIDSDCIE